MKLAKLTFAVIETVGDLRIVGMPDYIVGSEGRSLWLVELKTTKSDQPSLWPDQMNQIHIYGLLLELRGFDCSRLRIALVRLRAGELTEEERGQVQGLRVQPGLREEPLQTALTE